MKILRRNPEDGTWSTLTEDEWIRIEVDGVVYDLQADMHCARGGEKMEGGLQIMGVDNRERNDYGVTGGCNGHLKLWMHTANNITVGPR